MLLIQLKKYTAFAVLMTERLSLSFWKAFFWLLFFCGLWLLNFAAVFGVAGETIAAFIFWAGFIFFVKHGITTFRFPNKNDVYKRLEQDSNLAHRPLSQLSDKLLHNNNPNSQALWSKADKSAKEQLKKLTFPKLKIAIANQDRYAIRLLALLCFVSGVLATQNPLTPSIKHGIFPIDIQSHAFWQSRDVIVWITPPEYTNKPPTVIEGVYDGAAMNIPEGSNVKVSVKGGFFKASLVFDDTAMSLSRIEKQNQTIETDIQNGRVLHVKQLLMPTVSIPYQLIADHTPSVQNRDGVQILSKGDMRFPLRLHDDYGVENLTITVTLDSDVNKDDAPNAPDIIETNAVISGAGQVMDIEPVYNLSWHYWAGLPVEIRFEVSDAIGQKNQTELIKLVLPEREFTHPVAQKLIEIRQRLIWTPEMSGLNAKHDIESMMVRPQDYAYDGNVFLSLRTMASRLYLHQGDITQISDSVISQLWDTALHIEDGNLSLAERKLKQARQNLEALLNSPEASDEDIARAMAKLREALAEYFTEMAREMQQKMAEGEAYLPAMNGMNNIDIDGLAAYLDKLQSESLSGERQKAREMLSKLGRFMDQLSPSIRTAMPPEMQFMQDAMNKLQHLIQKQEELLSRTRAQALPFAQAQTMVFDDFNALFNYMRQKTESLNDPDIPDKIDQVNTQKHADEQDALRSVLGAIMIEADEALGSVPNNMQSAELAMRSSSKALKNNRPDQSIPAQEEAIKHLKVSMENMSSQMQAMAQKMRMLSFGRPKTDPLGRPYGDSNNNSFLGESHIKIPNQSVRRKIHEILETLRKRTGEFERPDYERDYYNRLIKQF